MANLLACSIVAVLATVSFAAPKSAVNRIDVPGHRPPSTTIASSETIHHSSAVPRITFKPREPAVNRIDVAGVKVHHKPTSSSAYTSSFQAIVSLAVGPHITLNPRKPAVDRIDAVGVHAHRRTSSGFKMSETSVSLSSSSIRPYIPLNPRDPDPAANRIDTPGHKPHLTSLTSSPRGPHAPVEQRAPAVNRIDPVGKGVADQAPISADSGPSVTLAVSDA